MDIDRQEEQGGNNEKISDVGSKAEEMPPNASFGNHQTVGM